MPLPRPPPTATVPCACGMADHIPRAAILREAIRQHREAARERAIAAEAAQELRRLFTRPPDLPAYRALRR